MPGKAIWCLQNATNHWGSRGSAPDPAGEIAALPRPPSWWGGGWLPLPKKKNPTPALGLSGLGPLGLASPRPKFSNPLRSKILHMALFLGHMHKRLQTIYALCEVLKNVLSFSCLLYYFFVYLGTVYIINKMRGFMWNKIISKLFHTQRLIAAHERIQSFNVAETILK